MKLGTHQSSQVDGPTSTYKWQNNKPLVYQIKLQVAGHSFTSS